MLKQPFIACLIIVAGLVPSEARIFRTHQVPECNVTMPCDFSISQERRQGVFRTGQQLQVTEARAIADRRTVIADANVPRVQTVGGRPAGCPTAFCGCGAALRVFGRIVPELNLAANWLRFPRTSPSPGMVAARRGHVFVLEQHLGGDMWMAYGANSGGRTTRIHARSLRGYAIVNPHAT